MANIYVGFHDQRSCNRILKPPGGGTSNIFGTDSVPDIVPQVTRKESKQGSTIQQVLQNETVTTVTRKEERSSSTNGNISVEQNIYKGEIIGDGKITLENDFQEDVPVSITQEVVERQNGSSTPDVVEITSTVEQLRIEEKSSKSEVSETDASGNIKIISSNTNSEGSVEKSSSSKKGSNIQDILKQDDIEEKKKVRGQVQRVPPGGYSSGLW